MGYDVFEKLCNSRGVTPYRVAKATGVSTSTLSSWKTGRYTPKQDKLQRIADYFGITVDQLTGVQTNVQHDGYYYREDTARTAQQIFDDPYLRILFDAAQDSKPEDLQMAADLLRRLKQTNPDG